MRPPDLSLRSASAAAGAGLSVLPLVGGETGVDLAFVLVGLAAAAGAATWGRLPGARLRPALPTLCLLAAVGHLLLRPAPWAVAVAEAVLMAGYLALASEAEIARDTPSVQLRWAAAPLALASVGAFTAAGAAALADRTRTPLAIVAAGVAGVGLLFVELHRRSANAAAVTEAADTVRPRRPSRARGTRPR